MGKKVLMLLSNEFSPDVRVEKEAKALSRAGFEVTVLAWDRTRTKAQKEQLDGIDVVRIRTGQADRKIRMVMAYPFFFLRSLIEGLRTEIQAVHAHDLDTLAQGVLISWIKRVPLVYDAHEHYARMIEQDLPKLITRQLDGLESGMVKKADLVIAANSRIAEYLQPSAKRLRVVMNCAERSGRFPETPRKNGNQTVLFYAGSLEPLRYLEELIEAVSKRSDVQLRIAGSGSLEQLIKSKALASESIQFLGQLTRERVAEEMFSADAVIALLNPINENNRIGTPNRLFEAMMAGIPFIVSAGTLGADIVRECGCGIVLEWSEDGFAEAIKVLNDPEKIEALKRRSIQAFDTYNWTRMSAILVDAYGVLLESGS